MAEKLRLDAPPTEPSERERVVHAVENPTGEVTIGMVGKYVDLANAYKSLNEALRPSSRSPPPVGSGR